MKILVVEDDFRIAELIQRGLEQEDFFVSSANDGLLGRTLILNTDFDLVITDIILPNLSGIQLCKEIKTIKPELPIIMLTALGTTDEKVEGFDAGADDYIVKPFEMRELLARIRALLKRFEGYKKKADEVLKYADVEMNRLKKTVNRSGTEIALTPKEYSLLEFLLLNPERVLSRMEIAKEVWDTNFDTGTNFIDVYINYLRKKIDKNFNQKLIHTKSGMGFILKQE
jgi:DNA-binding response OmpR family regulator